MNSRVAQEPVISGHGLHRACIISASLAAAYVLARAAFVPLVHDECASLLWFVRPGEWLPYRAHWDANNHYLSSGIGILLTRLFGESLLTLRAGSVLAFMVYAWAAWRIGAQVRDRFVRACLWAALLLCPFLLDFFSLFRGYGIELAGWLVALDGMMRCSASLSLRHSAQALIGVLVAAAAIVALLPVWAILLVFLAALFWRGRQRLRRNTTMATWAGLVLFGVLPLLYATGVALELKERGLLYHGGTDGYFQVTVTGLCRYVLGSGSGLMAGTVVLLIVIATAVAVREFVRSKNVGSPLVLINVLLWSDVLLRILMAGALGVNFPEDRAAIHVVPLVLLSIALAIDRLAVERRWMAWTAALLLLLPMRTILTANLDHTLAWPEQSVPLRFIERVHALQKASERMLVVGGHHQLALAWPMNAGLHDLDGASLQTEGFPGGEQDLRIADKRFLRDASIGYYAIDSASGPGLWLLARDRPLEVEAISPLSALARSGADEFMELAHVPDSLLRREAVRVEVTVPLTILVPSPDIRLVIEVNEAKGVKLFYDAVAPLAHRPAWNGERLLMARSLPPLPAASRVVIYLHNPERTPISHGEARITVSAIRR